MSHDLVSIFVSAIMPIAIVAIVFINSMNRDNKRTKILIKAIESNNVDAAKLAELLQKPQKTPRELLNRRLLLACRFSFVGIALCLLSFVTQWHNFMPITVPLGILLLAVGLSYLVVYFVTRRQIND